MWRASWLLALAALAAPARADDAPAPHDPRAALARQLADEAATIDRALDTGVEKLGAIDAARARRLAAAARVLDGVGAAGAEMAAARRRAAARLLVERDLAERRLLADEATALRAARIRRDADALRVAALALPDGLARPVKGAIARRFGTLRHERSKATLARRGLDFDVEARAPVDAPADGVVRYAGPIRGLDAGVVLDHGDYLTILGKLGELAVPAGAPVRRGDRLGRAARHRVYLEVRAKVGPGGLPIDPEPLLERRRAR